MSKLRKEIEGNGRLCLEKNKMMWKKNDRNEEEIRLEEKVGRRFEGRGQEQQPETRN